MIFDNRLLFPPINNPQRILECGYGNCDWSISVAESYPDCEVCVDRIPQPWTHLGRASSTSASSTIMIIVITSKAVIVIYSTASPLWLYRLCFVLEIRTTALMWEQVLGVDISPHLKPEETPENLYLQVSAF